MAMTAQQIVTLACQVAKVPGMTAQGGQLLNMVLQELAQTYDMFLARKTFQFNFNTGLADPLGLYQPGTGPYELPADFLRCVDEKSVFWTLLGVRYPLVPIDLSQLDMTVQQAGLQSYPMWFATDLSLADNATPAAYIWPPPSGNFPVVVRYFAQLPDIVTPETSNTVPWFPNGTYLYTRVAGELMKIADDERWMAFLGDGPEGAQGILDRYLRLKDDTQNRATTVKLDRRRFGTNFRTLPNTKTIGW